MLTDAQALAKLKEHYAKANEGFVEFRGFRSCGTDQTVQVVPGIKFPGHHSILRRVLLTDLRGRESENGNN